MISGRVERAAVFAEEHHHACLARLDFHEATAGDDVGNEQNAACHTCCYGSYTTKHFERKNYQAYGHDVEKQVENEHADAVECHSLENEFLVFHKMKVFLEVLDERI